MVLARLQVLVGIYEVNEGDGDIELVWVGVGACSLQCLHCLTAELKVLLERELELVRCSGEMRMTDNSHLGRFGLLLLS